MRNLRSSLTLLAAALYVLLGVSASWHAPHFSRGDVAVGSDRHDHHEAVSDGECALCSVKTSPHLSGAPASAAVFASRTIAAPRPLTAPAFVGFRGADRARAPPVLS